MSALLNLDELRNQVLDQVCALSMDDLPYGHFRPRLDSEPSYWGSAHIALVLHTVNVINYIPPEYRTEFVDALQNHQDEATGAFKQDLHPPFFGMALGHQAMRVLSASPRHPFSELRQIVAVDGIEAFLTNLPWDEPGRAAEQLYGAGSLLVASPSTDPAIIDTLFDWLDANQNPRTGWWIASTHLEHKPDYLLTAWAISNLYRLASRPLPRPDVLCRSALRLQVRMGPMKGLFGSIDRPHWSEMCAAGLLLALKDQVDKPLLKELSMTVRRLLDVTHVFFTRMGAEAHGLDTTAGLLARVQILCLLSRMLPSFFRARRPWKPIWPVADLLACEY